ncbi:hypothetical protein MIND_00366000 [Mycena indigotica]|uniref:Uncharacterized protein n=1 Tax=Mycena indigotica TaxID=2126181 RepID=A0A8H6T2P6_9AGAR|nr:uncharacterized protein MIND_00366000 [Mycena indigotica]KAF7309936.1 hypothetical protein MIND_00366000 [Mycena indigotica]
MFCTRTQSLIFPRIRPTLSPLYQKRTEASSVGLVPGSQTLAQATRNIREEAGNSAKDLARAIAGANLFVQDKAKDGFVGLTKVMVSEVPKPVLIFGLAAFGGGLPYIGTGLTTVYLAHQASLEATSTVARIDPGIATNIFIDALHVQTTYGAVVLSFLGALHWGMEFAEYNGRQGWKRLALGAAPVLIAWPTLALEPTLGLCAQWAAFTGLWWLDLKATAWGWGILLFLTLLKLIEFVEAPRWYAQYRFYLSILAGSCILGTLGGLTYWGPVGGHGFMSSAHELHLVRETRRALYDRNPEVNYGTELIIVKGDDEGRFMRLRRKEDVIREELARSKRQRGLRKEDDDVKSAK